MANWDESKKFWADTWRTAIFAVLGLVGGILIVENIKNHNSYSAEIEKQRRELKASIVDNFISCGYTYTSYAKDACDGDSLEKILFREDAYGNFRIAQAKMKIYFSEDIKEIIILIAKTSDSIKSNIDTGGGKDRCEEIRARLKNLNEKVATRALKEIGIVKK